MSVWKSGLCFTWKSNNRWQNNVENRRNCSWGANPPPFKQYFQYAYLQELIYIFICEMWLLGLFFHIFCNLICWGMDILKYFRAPLVLRDNESRCGIKPSKNTLKSTKWILSYPILDWMHSWRFNGIQQHIYWMSPILILGRWGYEI